MLRYPNPKTPSRDPHVALLDDSEFIAQWRERMGSDVPAKDRSAASNAPPLPSVSTPLRAGVGSRSLSVRGLNKVKAVALWLYMAHNLMRAVTLAQTA